MALGVDLEKTVSFELGRKKGMKEGKKEGLKEVLNDARSNLVRGFPVNYI